jgi:hypothetical protein
MFHMVENYAVSIILYGSDLQPVCGGILGECRKEARKIQE